MAAGEVVEVVLELADVTLEARLERIAPRHVLAEEQRRRALAAVDRGRAADDERLERVGALAGREQLQRADHVDVVQRAVGLAGRRVPEERAVDDGVDLGARQQPRQHRAADVGLDELGALELAGRRLGVDPGDELDRGIALEPPRELGRPVIGDPGDRDALAAGLIAQARPQVRGLRSSAATRRSISSIRRVSARTSLRARQPQLADRLDDAARDRGRGVARLLAAARDALARLLAAARDVVEQLAARAPALLRGRERALDRRCARRPAGCARQVSASVSATATSLVPPILACVPILLRPTAPRPRPTPCCPATPAAHWPWPRSCSTSRGCRITPTACGATRARPRTARS